ncbi:FHA domain-containing protein [Herbiconiux moechotypicola]|uniref:FHA domain-containing protein n=1 Tax=Herbiconiux moechotypicola TaxID=637393 RepID=A0ABN3D851_9MICO|nr:FHA domain-containing protein [Herbiconiux moechotypicola]MCS5728313.1 FHA domain-containing protein [Herbiconiux moechotypicola]
MAGRAQDAERDPWRAVASGRFLVIVDAGVSEEVWQGVCATVEVESLPENIGPAGQVHTGGLERIVSAIPVRGVDAVDHFAVVELPPARDGVAVDEPGARTVMVVARGGAEVELLLDSGAHRHTARGAEPWSLAEFPRVRAVRAGPTGWSAGTIRARHDGDRGHEPVTTAGEPGTTPAPAFTVRVNDGPLEPLRRPLVVGRRPRALLSAPHSRAETPTDLRAVTSPAQLVSATHVEIAPSGDVVVVTDLGSTNGTRVVPGHGTPVRLRKGDSAVVPVSAIVEIGDGNVIHILPSGPDGFTKPV